jgi:4-hydroxy-3-polyprenylbenzoate decarboxylase
MGYRSLRESLLDLERHRHLVRVREEVDPHLEMAEIQRRAYLAGAPALLFENVKGSRFQAASNLFGTLERARFLFRDSLEPVKRIVHIKADPGNAWRSPRGLAAAPWTALRSLPKSVSSGPVLENRGAIADIPRIQSWPDDGGPFITLPQVYTEHPDGGGVMKSNLGMYRVQLAGNATGTRSDFTTRSIAESESITRPPFVAGSRSGSASSWEARPLIPWPR